MSWYNDDLNNGFIDTTQDFVGGGGSSTTITNIQEDLTALKEVFKPKVLDNTNASLDTIIVNNTANSRIFLQNANTSPKVKIEDGHLYLYYDYNANISLFTASGYIKVGDYIIGLNTGLNNVSAGLSGAGLLITANTTQITEHTGQIATIITGITTLEGEVSTLESGVSASLAQGNALSEYVKLDSVIPAEQFLLNRLTPTAGTRLLQSAIRSGESLLARTFTLRNLFDIKFLANNALMIGTLAVIFLVGGTPQLVINFIYAIRDLILSFKQKNDARRLAEIYDIAKDKSDFNVKNKLLETGLTIDVIGNDNMADGEYDITIKSDTEIKFKVLNGQASVIEVIQSDDNNSVGDHYMVLKSLLGGVLGGSIKLNVVAVYSYNEVLTNLINKNLADVNDIKNRKRRRDKILNEDTIGDNFIIEYTPLTESTGEISQVPTIKLNLNSAQLETINGVLNIKKYVNQDNIDIINGNISVQDAEIADINASLERVYKVILPTGQTITSDYKLNLGYKEIFTGFPYDLIMLAIKKDTYTTFSSANYNYDYLGYFPNMNRLSQYGDIKVISDSTLTVNTSQHFTKGFIYMKNTNELKSFNLNRKFEFVSFLKFVSFNNNVTDYHLIQTAVDLGQGFIEIDYTKFSLYIRNRRFKIKHPAVVEYQIYTPSNNNNITDKLITPNTYVILEPYTIGGTIYNDNIRIGEQYIAGNPNDFQYDLRMINVPYKINNNTPHINTPTGLIKSVNSNDTSTPTNDSRYIQMYLNHPSNPNTSYANCIFPTIQYSIGMTQAGVVAGTPTWHIQKIVLVFGILFHIMIDTNPPGGGGENPPPYVPFPSIQQYEKAETNSMTDFTFRLRYSFDGITYITHNFTMNDVVGEAVYDTPFNYVDTGFYGNDITLKQRWTYTFNIPTTYPIYGNKVRFVDFTLVRKPNFPYHSSYASGTATTAYHNQAMLHLYEFKLTEYETTLNPTMIQTTAINYETTDENTPLIGLSSTPWYLFNLQMDLQNDYISYFINDTFYEITSRAPIKLYPSDIVMPDSTIPFITASFLRWGNLTLDNSLLVIGNLPSTGSINFTHFNWRYFQSNETFLTLAEYQKLKGLINYIYYYDYVSVDKLLDTNEISANNIITRQLVINNNPIINSLTSSTRSRDLRTNQTQEVANVLIPLTNLYVVNPIKSGTIFYNFLTKSFTIGTGTRSEEEDDAILDLIGTTAGVGLQWDATTNKLNVIPEDLYQDLAPVYTQIETASNILLADFVARDAVLNTKIETTSNYLKGVIDSIPIYNDTALTALVNTNDLNVSNYVRTTSNYLKGVIDNIPIYDDTALTALVNTNDLNVSNYVRTTSNYLKGVIDNIPIYDDTALTALVNTNDLNVSNFVRTSASKWTANAGTIYATDLGSNIVIGQVQTGTSGSKFKVYPNSGQNACFFNGSVVMGTASSTSIFWNGLTDTYLARANAIGSYSSSSIVGDVVISSDKNIIIKSGANSVTPSIYVKQTDGNVGIGKNNPSYTLDVGGNINCSAILVNGSSIPIYDDTALTALVNTKDANVSNYVRTTSNILLADFVARDAVLNTKINTTSNILLADFVARDAVLNTKINTTSNILLADFVARDAVLKTDYITRDAVLDSKINTVQSLLLNDYIARDGDLNTAITTNAYSDTKVSTYLGNSATKTFNSSSLVVSNTGVGVGVTPAVKFQVGASGALRVSTGTNDYTLIGTADADSATNTRIVLSSNARTNFAGRIQYLATSTGYHSFHTNNANSEVFRISNTGLYFQNNNWHLCLQGYRRFYFGSTIGGGITFISGGQSTGANAKTIEFRRTYDDATLGYFENTGLLRSWGYSSLSDERIKKNIRDIDDDEALQKILLIQPKKYNYVEKDKNKGKDIIGFIAQQINEVIPEAVTKTNGIIPNIYKYCSVINKREIQYSIPLNVPIDTDIIITADEDGMGERYKIKEIYDDYFVIDKDLDYDLVFVKGYEITDLHNLNKDMIFTLNVNATQELHRTITRQQNEITDLKERLAKLETVVMNMLSGSI